MSPRKLIATILVATAIILVVIGSMVLRLRADTNANHSTQLDPVTRGKLDEFELTFRSGVTIDRAKQILEQEGGHPTGWAWYYRIMDGTFPSVHTPGDRAALLIRLRAHHDVELVGDRPPPLLQEL